MAHFRILFLLTLFTLIQCSTANAACASAMGTCQTFCGGCTYTWDRYDLAGTKLLGCGACDDSCPCGTPGTGPTCGGCNYQSKVDNAFCFTNNDCTGACTPVPEIPSMVSNYSNLFAFAVGFICLRKKKNKSLS